MSRYAPTALKISASENTATSHARGDLRKRVIALHGVGRRAGGRRGAAVLADNQHLSGVDEIRVGDVVEAHEFRDGGAKARGNFREIVVALHGVGGRAAGRGDAAAFAEDQHLSLIHI